MNVNGPHGHAARAGTQSKARNGTPDGADRMTSNRLPRSVHAPDPGPCSPSRRFKSLGAVAFEGEHARGKHFPRLLPVEGLLAQAPAVVSGHAQAIEMGLDAFIQFRQILQRVMGGCDGAVAE